MYYIDNYNSKTISNKPPKKELVDKLKSVSKEFQEQQLNTFWRLIGITISENFDAVKDLLDKYGYKVVNEEDSAVAIVDIWATPKWLDFVKELSILVEGTIDEKLVENLIPKADESSFVEIIVAAVGQIAGGALNLAANKKQLEAQKENAKTQMIAALTQAKMEKERLATERIKANAQEKKTVIWVVSIMVILILVIIMVAIIRRRNQAKQS